MVGVRMAHKPNIHLVTQSSQKSTQIIRFLFGPTIHDSYLPVIHPENIRVPNGVDLRLKLPNFEIRFRS
jgi:hypothetical protein